MRFSSRFFWFKIGLVLVSVCLLVGLALPTYAQQPNYREVGQIIIWPAPDGVLGYTIPYGYFRCDGRVLSTTTYPALFATIGYVYGGSGVNFQLPNLEHKVVLGADNQGDGVSKLGCGVTNDCITVVGYSGGEISHTLSMPEMPYHRHLLYSTSLDTASGSNRRRWGDSQDNGQVNNYTGYAGGDQAHNNIPPYMALNYLIAYTTAYTSAAPTATPTTQPTYTPMPTYTPAPTYTPVPTYTPMPTYTPESCTITCTGTITGVATPDAYTHTLSSGHAIYLPLVISSGQLYVGFILISLCLAGGSLFLVRLR